MKIVDFSSIPHYTKGIVTILKGLIKGRIIEGEKKKQPCINALLSIYSTEDIMKAIDSIYAAGKIIIAPTDGEEGKILRYLEYGGESVSQSNIIRLSANDLNKKLGGKIYVF